MAASSSSCCSPSSAYSASCWRGIIDSCNQICHRNEEVLDRSAPSRIIVYRSKWRCLTRSYSLVLQSLDSRLLVSSLDPNEEILCTQKLIVSLEALYQTMQEGEVCLRDCTVESFSQSWLKEKALKLWTSTDVVDLHLHDFIWAYATVLESHFDSTVDSNDVVREVCKLSKIWEDEDAEEDFSVAQELLNKFKCQQEGELSVLADFIQQKLAFLENRSDVARDVVPPFLWVDHGSLQTNRTEFLGQGSFGIVYVAGWLGGRFAVKDIFYSETCQSTEPAIQARLRHPNVVNLLCCAKNSYRNGGCSMVMELMQNDLRDLMLGSKEDGKNGTWPFSLLEAVDLMLQVAKGMEYLHNLNIMHRDLKSSNILVSFPASAADASHKPINHRAAHIKITDFGMAKAKETSSYFTTKPTGTLFWRAPEVFDDTSEVKYRKTADVYSFGLICYEILTGKLPFEDTKELKRRVIGGERPELPSYCPSALASYIQRCWNGLPLKRPSFTGICMMLRYFKACILLDNHGPKHSSATHNNWLQYPLFISTCNRINDMLQATSEVTRCVRPLPLTILLEMYCCRMVLQESKDYTPIITSPSKDCIPIITRPSTSEDSESEPDSTELQSDIRIDEDPLPDIEGLCINGDVVVGSKILACGNSINGTILCHFQWVRHHRDGRFFHIPGAAQPDYTITADDVDTCLSLECTPMDDRNRKGEMIHVFVNNRNLITLEADMKDQITEYLENARVDFGVKLVEEVDNVSSFQPAVLSLRRSIYELKRVNLNRIIRSERYTSKSALVEIKVEKDSMCAIINNTGFMLILDCYDNDNRMRDLIVLTMREFIKAAVARKRNRFSLR